MQPAFRLYSDSDDLDCTVGVGGGYGRIADGLTASRSCQGTPESTS